MDPSPVNWTPIFQEGSSDRILVLSSSLFTRAPALQAGGALEKSQIVALHRSICVRRFGAVTTKSRG